MKDFTPWQRACSHEAIRMSLEAVKDWLPNATKIRRPGSETEEVLTDETRAELNSKIALALTSLNNFHPQSFDVDDLYNAGHEEVVLFCLEFYGEYINSMLTFIGHMYRKMYAKKLNVTEEEIVAYAKGSQEEAQ